ncbi:hypothetical protein I6N98_13970 [Spongiibacter nanhainus]|uniref:Uncharacterized protein n=1 Tax=Spongiibacter nanhainus TaxID=2794344 RepID=A0A7T4QZ85_9GAMM|nr:hypothetical protein [Spongiibacter nanhainus]QQD17461.1 hypothetical protein I6N98_13970 [Spongiibacter nanhainus]
MKKEYYVDGEQSHSCVEVFSSEDAFGQPISIAFAQLWPQSSTLREFDHEWLEFDERDVGCRIRNKTARSIENACTDFVKTFYPGCGVGVKLKNLIAKDCTKQRNQRTVLMLTGDDNHDISDKLSLAVSFVGERLIQKQGDLFFSDSVSGLSVADITFLMDHVDKIRMALSGSKITHPFALETFGPDPRVSAFSGRFDEFEFELPAAEEVSGTATVDGFRGHHNLVYLSIMDVDTVVDASKTFVIHDTKMLKLITEAKHHDAHLKYVADKIFEKTPDKPTFILKSVEIMR